MNIIITGILLVAGYFAINQSLTFSVRGRSTSLAVSAVVLMLYLAVVIMFGLFYITSGYDWFIIYAALVMLSLGMLGLFIWRIIRNWQNIRQTEFIVCLLYAGLVFYATVWGRIGSVDSGSIRTEALSRVTDAVAYGDMELLEHFILNVGMLVPLGFLMKLCSPSESNGWGSSLLLGLVLSTMIETCQMLLRLGECDIDDIIANTFGCVLGFLAAAFLLRVQRNWRI